MAATILEIANTDLKRTMLLKAMQRYYDEITRDLKRATENAEEFKSYIGKDKKTAVARHQEREEEFKEMFDCITEEISF